MAISIIKIARNSVKFTSVQAISAVAGLIVTMYVATILVPEEYGKYGLLALWLMYATLIGPNIYNAAQREIPVLLGRGQDEDALKKQNISISAELLYLVLPVIVIIGASFFFDDTVLRIGLLLIAASYITNRVTQLWSHTNFMREKFNTVARGNLIIALASPVFILIGVHWLKVYALVAGPLAAHAIAVAYYFTRGGISFRFHLEKGEIIRLVKIGLVLQGLGLAFWGFRMADRTIIASALPLEQLGLYTFAIGFLTYALAVFADFGRVLQPVLWREAGTAESVFTGFKDTRRIAVYLALVTAICIPLAQLVFYLIVTLITRKYIDSIPIFYVLSYNLFLAAVAIVPSLILNSSLVNKQRLSLYFYAVGLVLNIALDLLVIRLGYGVVGVAWVTIGTQGLVTFVLYYFIRGYIFNKPGDFIKFMASIIAPFLVSIPFYFIHLYLNKEVTGTWIFIGISLAAQIAVWGLIVGIFYRDYLSMRELRFIVQEIRTVLSKTKTGDIDSSE